MTRVFSPMGKPLGGIRSWAPLLLLLLLLLVSGIYSYRLISQEMTHAVLTQKSDIGNLAARVLQERLERLQDLTHSLGTRPLFRQMVQEKRWGEIEALLKEWLKDFPVTDRFVVVDEKAVCVLDVPSMPGVRGKDYSYRDWYQGAMKSRKSHVSEIFSRSLPPHEHQVAATFAIESEVGKVVGFLQLQVLIDRLIAWRSEIDVGTSGFIYFVDPKGHVAGHPQFPSQGEVHDFSGLAVIQKVLRGIEGVEMVLDPVTKEENVVAYEAVSPFGWGAIVAQPTRKAFQERDRNLRVIFWVYALIFSIALLFTLLIFRAEAVRWQAEERFRVVVESAPNAMVMVNSQGQITLVNTQTETLFGYTREELMGQKVEILVPERYRASHPGHREGFLRDPQTRAIGAGRDLYGRKKNGEEVPIEIGLNTVQAAEGTLVLASIIDITERKRIEEVRIRLVDQLAKANKELASFAYVVSHDLKAPLRGIASLAGWIVEDCRDRLDEEGKKKLGLLQMRVEKMNTLIDGILEYSRIGRTSGEIEPIGLNKLLGDIVELLDPPAHIKIEVQKNLPVIRGEKTRVHQLFQNLLSNAIKYNDKPQGRIQVASEDAGNFLRFKVSDNGPGIEEKHHERIFELFQTLGSSENPDSTGIGLSLAKKIVETSGGTIGVQSKPGQGSTFWFTYPKIYKMKGEKN